MGFLPYIGLGLLIHFAFFSLHLFTTLGWACWPFYFLFSSLIHFIGLGLLTIFFSSFNFVGPHLLGSISFLKYSSFSGHHLDLIYVFSSLWAFRIRTDYYFFAHTLTHLLGLSWAFLLMESWASGCKFAKMGINNIYLRNKPIHTHTKFTIWKICCNFMRSCSKKFLIKKKTLYCQI